ncbi:protein phosphatase 2C domain-containing protein [Dactylosporangium sp. CS-047395]|uniref:protein phosphatase 2C domain-containing protein n=1 Tax=Dactylosporangium sp. CS-047395 TaxID=3239936 RepID=UPI003D9113F6
MVAALADGAGSAAASEIGAAAAVQAVVAAFEHLGGRGRPGGPRLVRVLLRAARFAVLRAAAEHERPARDLACTLAVLVAGPDGVHAGQIGDGVVVARTAAGLDIAAPPLRGEYANESTFLTTGPALPDIEITSRPESDVDAFALSSDGLRLLITHAGGRPYEPFFADVFVQTTAGATEEHLRRFLGEVDDRTGDDKSLIAAVRAVPDGR